MIIFDCMRVNDDKIRMSGAYTFVRSWASFIHKAKGLHLPNLFSYLANKVK